MAENMTYRAVTQKTAEWIGMAASVAGGYVAINGPRVVRTPADEIRRMLDAYHSDTRQRPYAEELDRLGKYQIRGGDYVGLADYEDGHLVMRVPATAGLAKEGYGLPADFVAAVVGPALAAAGYEVD